MFKVFLNDGKNVMPKDDVFYIIGKKGVFLRKKLGLVDALVPVKQLSFLEDVQPFVNLMLPKLKKNIVGQVAGFFRAVYNEYRYEAVVMIYLNEDRKNYTIHVPPQKVTAASASYMRNAAFTDKTLVCSIHSHASMSAFHSGTDVADEESFDGLHVTFGNMDEDPQMTIAASAAANGERCIVLPEQYLDVKLIGDAAEEPEVDETSTNYQKNKHLVKYYFKKTPRYEILSRPFPKEWMNFVEGTKWTPSVYSYARTNWWDERSYKKSKGLPFDEEVKRPFVITPQTPRVPKTKEVFDPCKECIFSDKKATCYCDGHPKLAADAELSMTKDEYTNPDYLIGNEDFTREELLKMYGFSDDEILKGY